MKTGIELIAEERDRQIKVEGWTAEHDDRHGPRNLARAAMGYAQHYVGRAWVYCNELELPGVVDGPKEYREEPAPNSWPWEEQWWKPKDPLRDLIRAGALIAAEIDRLQRAQQKAKLNAAAEEEQP